MMNAPTGMFRVAAGHGFVGISGRSLSRLRGARIRSHSVCENDLVGAAPVRGCRNTSVAASREVVFRSGDWGTDAESTLRMPVGVVKQGYSDSLVRKRASSAGKPFPHGRGSVYESGFSPTLSETRREPPASLSEAANAADLRKRQARPEGTGLGGGMKALSMGSTTT